MGKYLFSEIREIMINRPFLLQEMYKGKEENNPLELFLYYKGDAKSDGIDIDVSLYNMFVYGTCYENIIVNENTELTLQDRCKYKYEMKRVQGLESFTVRGDTAVNCMSILVQIASFTLKKRVYAYEINAVREGIIKSFEEEPELKELIEKHVKLCYGIGNFYPIPFLTAKESLNQKKGVLRVGGIKIGGNRKVMFMDSLQVFLKVMYQYFVENNLSSCKLIESVDKHYRDWAESFGKGQKGWKQFVDINCFNSFVNNSNELCEPIDFFSISQNTFTEDVKKYLKSINAALEERENELVLRIKKAETNDILCKLFELPFKEICELNRCKK
ncbi:MAG: hypothetical protein J6C64_10145 [Lachnospiraceae bacterium]|nr:hypothetical protein [Lachnospiraceae bacterium]